VKKLTWDPPAARPLDPRQEEFDNRGLSNCYPNGSGATGSCDDGGGSRIMRCLRGRGNRWLRVRARTLIRNPSPVGPTDNVSFTVPLTTLVSCEERGRESSRRE